MLRKLTAAALLCVCSALYAYNPPAGGQNLFRIASPDLLTDASSSAGGALSGVSSDSVVNNPALTAYEQRIVLNLSGTLLFDSKDASDKSMGGAFEGGILFPSRWCVSSFLMQGIFVPFYEMHLGNNFALSANVAKDLNDKLAIGMNFAADFFWGYDSDWAGGVNMGALYKFGDLFFMKDLRFGAALLNVGKTLKHTDVYGVKGDYASDWPGIATPKMGIAACLLDKPNFDIGASVDFSFPAFQDFVFDAGFQILICDIVKVSSSWEYDVCEYSEGAKNIVPSLGVSVQFKFYSKDGSILANKGWAQSEMTAGAAWKQLYKNVNAVSAGAKLNLGLKDTQPPEIILWGEE